MVLATGWGWCWEPLPGLCWAVRSLFGRGPSPLKPFVASGCSFLIPSFSPVTQPRQEIPSFPPPPPLPGRFGKQRSSLGDTLETVLEEWGCTGTSESQLGKKTGLPPFSHFVILAKPLGFLGLGVLICTIGQGSLVLTLMAWVPKGIMPIPRMEEGEAVRNPWMGWAQALDRPR